MAGAYTAAYEIAASPWDVYELLVDPMQQAQWRDRWARPLALVDQQPYTRVDFEGGLMFEVEPAGSGTLLRCTALRSPNGASGKLGRLLTSRRSVESDLLAQLKRIASTVESGGI